MASERVEAREFTRATMDTVEWGEVPILSLPDGVNDFVRDPDGAWWHLAPPSLRVPGAPAFSASHMADELDAALRSWDDAHGRTDG